MTDRRGLRAVRWFEDPLIKEIQREPWWSHEGLVILAVVCASLGFGVTVAVLLVAAGVIG